MTIKLKQPLRLADNLSAFDPQTPLNLSPDMSSVIAIPIADKSAVAGERVGQAKLVTNIPRHVGTKAGFGGTGVETFTKIWVGSSDLWIITFAQPIIGYFFTMEADDGGNRIFQDLPSADEFHVRTFQRWKRYWCLARTTRLYFFNNIVAGISECWVTGVY